MATVGGGGMEVSVSARTAHDLAELAKKCKDTGNRDLKNKLTRNMRATTQPARAAIPESARNTLPSGGGLAARVAGAKIATRTTTAGARVGVRIQVVGNLDVESLNDDGSLRHPVYDQPGKTRVWAEQKVPPGFVDKPLTALLPVVQTSIDAVMTEIARELD